MIHQHSDLDPPRPSRPSTPFSPHPHHPLSPNPFPRIPLPCHRVQICAVQRRQATMHDPRCGVPGLSALPGAHGRVQAMRPQHWRARVRNEAGVCCWMVGVRRAGLSRRWQRCACASCERMAIMHPCPRLHPCPWPATLCATFATPALRCMPGRVTVFAQQFAPPLLCGRKAGACARASTCLHAALPLHRRGLVVPWRSMPARANGSARGGR